MTTDKHRTAKNKIFVKSRFVNSFFFKQYQRPAPTDYSGLQQTARTK